MEEQKLASASDSSDAEFNGASEGHEKILAGFKYSFGKSSFQLKGKQYRRKLKWFLALLPSVSKLKLRRASAIRE